MRASFVDVAAAVLLAAYVALAVAAPYLPLPDPSQTSAADQLQPPSVTHPLGTDDLGRDLLSRLVWGGRTSLTIGGLAVGLAFGLGMPIGLVGGYVGGWFDRGLESTTEALLAFPSILLAILLAAILGPGPYVALTAVGLAQAPLYARQTRVGVLAVREQEYVLAARAIGASPLWILGRHVLPNVLSPVLVLATMGLGGAILEAAGLSFLGLTGDPNRAEWGNMLTTSRERFLEHPLLVIAPGLAITTTVLAFNRLGDALRDHLDPRSGRR